MTEFTFKLATKYDAKLRMAIAGPSGSGKTYTALTLAQHLGEKIAVLDTEHGSASKYADLFRFDVVNMEPPFHPTRYIEALHAAEKAGYDVFVGDSFSHGWMGAGGILELVDELAKRMQSSNTFAAWGPATKLYQQLIEAIIRSPCHVIVTLRSKEEYVQDKDERGKIVVRKLGMQPIQRDGFQYEFDVFGMMDQDNNFIVLKTRCPALFNQVIERPGEGLAKQLLKWLGGEPMPEPELKPLATVDQEAEVYNLLAPIDPNSHGKWWESILRSVGLAETEALIRLTSMNWDPSAMSYEYRKDLLGALKDD